MQWVNYIFIAFALVLLVPVTVLCAECLAALLPGRRIRSAALPQLPATQNPVAVLSRPAIAVLIPAHNEEAVLHDTLESLIPQLHNGDRIVVVADNCNDDTCKIARSFGAIVLNRHDTINRGKGFALDFGISHLRENAPDILIMMDADCTIHEGAIDALVAQVTATGRPAQACYLMESPANPKPKDCVSALAFLIKNLVRPRGLFQLGLPCLLTGTGMAFPWSVIANARLASGNIVEDMQLGLDLAMDGHAPLFCGGARVTGHLPKQNTIAYGQRTRWEHGHLQTMLTQAPRMLKAGIKHRRLQALALAMELSVPPLALLVMMLNTAFVASATAGLLGASWLPAKLLAAGVMAVVISLFCAWSRFGRKIVPMSGLVAAPLYMAWKVPMYFAFLFKRHTEWNRTCRVEPVMSDSDDFELSPAGTHTEEDFNVDLPVPDSLPIPAMGLETAEASTAHWNGLGRRTVTASQCITHLFHKLEIGEGGIVVQPTAAHLHWCARDPDFASVMAKAELVVADALPLAWANRLQGTPLPHRGAGADFCWNLISNAADRRRTVFLLGDDVKITHEAAIVIQGRFPQLLFSGTYDAPDGFDSHHEAFQHVAHSVGRIQPDIVLVALGTPKQERLIDKLREKLPHTWWITVGNNFRSLCNEPHRIWSRGVRGNFNEISAEAQADELDPAVLGRRYLIGGMPFAASLLSEVAAKRLARILSTSAPQEKVLLKAIEEGIEHLTVAEVDPVDPVDPAVQVINRQPAPSNAIRAGSAMVYQSFLHGFMSEMGSPDSRGEYAPESTGPVDYSKVGQGPLGRLRAVVLLAGAIRPSRLSLALGRSPLDMPLEDRRSILCHWRDHAIELQRLIGLEDLSVRVMVDRLSIQPTAPPRGSSVRVTVERDASQYRGTAGVLRDLAENYHDQDYILVGNAAQSLLMPLSGLAMALAAPAADVTLVSHLDGSPSGLMLIRCEALRQIAPTGYVDMKEQALPFLATRFNIRHLPHTYPTGMPIRTRSEYVAAIQHRYRLHLGKPVSNDPFAEDCRPSFAIIEEGASVHPSAKVHDSVILSGAHVGAGALVVRSVIGPQRAIVAGSHIVDRLIAGERVSKSVTADRHEAQKKMHTAPLAVQSNGAMA